MGKKERLKRKRMREELLPVRKRLQAVAAKLFARGERDEALTLSLAACLLEGEAVLRMGEMVERGEAALLEFAREELERKPPAPSRKPPPWGWGVLQEALQEERFRGFGQGDENPFFFLLTYFAHFAPLHRAALAYQLWRAFRDRPDALESFLRALADTPPVRAERALLRGEVSFRG